MKKRREIEEFGLSFLDVICCGFGAIILLLLVTKISFPQMLETSLDDLMKLVIQKRESIEKILGETIDLKRERELSELSLSDHLNQLSNIEKHLEDIINQYEEALREFKLRKQIEGELTTARQSLTDEMERLLGSGFKRQSQNIGGIPVDSEYIIFVIDSSGSMQERAWNTVVRKLDETLNIYPVVKGIQVMNDMGEYMFPNYGKGQWLTDSPARRRAIIRKLKVWNAFSNSSPEEGIEEAVRGFYDPDKFISIYYFGDDFQGKSVERVVDSVDQVNTQVVVEGARRMRIHAVGFPVYFLPNVSSSGVYAFSHLMRELTSRNHGTFVGLPHLN